TIAVVDTDKVKDLLVDPAALWDTTLLELGEGETVIAMDLRRGGEDPISLISTEQGAWRMTAPIAAPADQENVSKILDKLDKFQASKIVAVGHALPAHYSGADAHIVLEITTRRSQATSPATMPATAPAEREYRIHVIRKPPHAYAWVEGGEIVAVGQFASQLYDDLAAELRNRAVWTVEDEDVTEIHIVRRSDSLTLRRDGEEWIYEFDPHVAIDAGKVGSFLKSIAHITALRFATYESVDEKRFGLSDGALTLTLSGCEGEIARITIGAEAPGGGRYAAVGGVAGVVIISGDDVAKLEKRANDFKKVE
ncbi:MAG: DUF4340 domain-containing protein, partial [Planctomycetes bacterium]|nr:DUF4340 domain-containing protein [Planctomycetota bacterium]